MPPSVWALLVAALLVQGEEECAACVNLPTWLSEACYPGTIVSDGTKVYRLSWEDLGPCCDTDDGPGTVAPTVPPTTSTTTAESGVDCSGYYKWSPHVAYEARETIHFEGTLFEAKDSDPGASPSDDPQGWKDSGTCREGTAVLGCHIDANGVGILGANRLCSCCKGCARKDGSDPICLDEVSEADCYETWCGDFDLFDPDRCQEVVDNNELTWWGKMMGSPVTEWPERIVAAYVDVTFTVDVPRLSEVAKSTGVKYFIMAFVRAPAGSEVCEGHWAGLYDIRSGTSWTDSDTGKTVYLYDEIRLLRELGGDVIVSFGGAEGDELCDHSPCLAGEVETVVDSYATIIDALNVTAIDFDIEGSRLAWQNTNSGWALRWKVVAELKQRYPDLAVWWTLPVSGDEGLTADGEMFVSQLFKAGTPMHRFNLMTMNYGASCAHKTEAGEPDMHACEQETIDVTADQLWLSVGYLKNWEVYGLDQDGDYTQFYPLLGNTPMIGLNNGVDYRYTLDNARAAVEIFRTDKPLGLLSQWSLNRDMPCAEETVALADCSGANLQTAPYEYISIFNSIND